MARRFAFCPLVLFLSLLVSAQDAPQRVPVSREVAEELCITRVNPVYPPLARQARIQGVVVLKVFISKTGDVEDVQLVSGHPLLAPAAIEAIKQWKFKPFLSNDEPMDVETTAQVNFRIRG
jgi:periplasmic protein TonB